MEINRCSNKKIIEIGTPSKTEFVKRHRNSIGIKGNSIQNMYMIGVPQIT